MKRIILFIYIVELYLIKSTQPFAGKLKLSNECKIIITIIRYN